ncbi:MAG: GFA family protein [Kiloniellales bacterium]
MTADHSHSGGCLCGGVRYRVAGPLRDVMNCHCSQCRRAHGHFAAYAAARTRDLVLLRQGGLAWYASSERARRGFCRICGASLFWQPSELDYVAIAAGSLDQPSGLRTRGHIYVADKGDYYEIADDLAQYPGGADAGTRQGGLA